MSLRRRQCLSDPGCYGLGLREVECRASDLAAEDFAEPDEEQSQQAGAFLLVLGFGKVVIVIFAILCMSRSRKSCDF